MEVDICIWSFEHSVLVPIRLANAKHIPGSFERRDIIRFVSAVRDYKQDVDDRLGSKLWNGCRAHVLNSQDAIPERRSYSPGFLLKHKRPERVVINDVDRAVQYLRLADRNFEKLIICCGYKFDFVIHARTRSPVSLVGG